MQFIVTDPVVWVCLREDFGTIGTSGYSPEAASALQGVS